ncbi:MAG: Nucleoside-diphosphate-sugar epimerase [Alphaproteobacteria bacterium]|jgi:nucleoside-diphosphate-sugar epimerase|nr:Nucleoside-diphosphate-sugar epimerase [Alphaproteobacteria bacterium]
MSGQVFFIFGLGYVGQHFGRALMTGGWRVAGTTRTQGQAQNLKNQGFDAVIWDGASPLPKKYLEGITHILVTIPPNEKGDVVLQHHHFSTASIRWVGYVSATSVYGDHQGAWVTENSPLKPTSLRGSQRLLAETQWLERRAQNPAFPIHIFRLSSIYGPGRSVLETILSGSAQRIDKPGHVFSRLHIRDIISVLTSSITAPQPGEIYNLADDEPAATADVIAYGCGLLKMAVPPLIPFEKASLSRSLWEFYAEEKRVCNHKIKTSLGIRLLYPTYREGLKHC